MQSLCSTYTACEGGTNMCLIQRACLNLCATCLAVLIVRVRRRLCCSPQPHGANSAKPPPPSPFPLVTVTGQVTDAAGRPTAANVVVYPLRSSPAWYGAWGRGSQADASGRYRIANAPEHHDTVYVRAWKVGYFQQCATAGILAGDTSADLTLVATGGRRHHRASRSSELPTDRRHRLHDEG